jgi:hypothetical protein
MRLTPDVEVIRPSRKAGSLLVEPAGEILPLRAGERPRWERVSEMGKVAVGATALDFYAGYQLATTGLSLGCLWFGESRCGPIALLLGWCLIG